MEKCKNKRLNERNDSLIQLIVWFHYLLIFFQPSIIVAKISPQKHFYVFSLCALKLNLIIFFYQKQPNKGISAIINNWIQIILSVQ